MYLEASRMIPSAPSGSDQVGVEQDLGLGGVEDLEHLVAIGLGIGEDLLAGKGRARLVLARRIADHPGEVANQELDLVAELLEVAQLVDDYRVAEVQVGRRGVQAEFDAQLPAGGELFLQLLLHDQLVAAPTNGLNGLLNGSHSRFEAPRFFARLRTAEIQEPEFNEF